MKKTSRFSWRVEDDGLGSVLLNEERRIENDDLVRIRVTISRTDSSARKIPLLRTRSEPCAHVLEASSALEHARRSSYFKLQCFFKKYTLLIPGAERTTSSSSPAGLVGVGGGDRFYRTRKHRCLIPCHPLALRGNLYEEHQHFRR